MKILTINPGYVLLLLIPSQAWSAQVYTWTDAGGITHFSEIPPAGAQIDTTVLEIEPAPVTRMPDGDDYYSVANQAARMAARRLENEKLRAEILRAEAQARKADADAAAVAREQAAAQAQERSTGYYPLYPYPPYYGHRRNPSYRDNHRFPPHRLQRPSPTKKLIVHPHKP